jgi:hypothetical protein
MKKRAGRDLGRAGWQCWAGPGGYTGGGRENKRKERGERAQAGPSVHGRRGPGHARARASSPSRPRMQAFSIGKETGRLGGSPAEGGRRRGLGGVVARRARPGRVQGRLSGASLGHRSSSRRRSPRSELRAEGDGGELGRTWAARKAGLVW